MVAGETAAWYGPAMIVAIAQQKGGAGKSTIAVALVAEGIRRGLQVIAVDGDPQRTLSVWHGVATEAGHPVPPLHCLGPDMHKQLPPLAKGAELVIVDTPPRHEAIVRAALISADIVILPSNGSAADVWSLAATAKLIVEARKVRPKLDARILLNRVRPNTAIGRAARDTLAAAGLPVMRTELADRIGHQEAMAAGQGPTTHAPGSAAATEVKALLDELMPRKSHAQKAPAR
jgi:chromosome partitioning protein